MPLASAVAAIHESLSGIRVTVSGRPVAELVPLRSRPRTMTWERFMRHLDGGRADPGLVQDLATMIPDSTDDASVR